MEAKRRGRRRAAQMFRSVADRLAPSPALGYLDGLTDTEFVDWAFRVVLDRTADREAHDYWTTHLAAGSITREGLIVEFATSEERRNRVTVSEHLSPAIDDMDDRAFVSWAFRTVVEREPDPAGLDHWVGQLTTGSAARSTLLLELAMSEERAAQVKRSSEFVPGGHFYSAVPSDDDRRRVIDLRRSGATDPLIDVVLDPAAQRTFVEQLQPAFADCPFPETASDGFRYYFDNTAFGRSDGLLLHAMLRHVRPRQVVEVGCGYSSALMMDTNDGWLDGSMKLTFIEPYPELLESFMSPDDRERYTILPTAVQDIPLDVFDALGDGDILFIDSTHVSKLGSDVNRLLFDVVPRLAVGVYVHIHDIPDAFEYHDKWIEEGRAWTEAYVLRAFLSGNADFEPVVHNPFFYGNHGPWITEHLPAASGSDGGTSFWMRRVAG